MTSNSTQSRAPGRQNPLVREGKYRLRRARRMATLMIYSLGEGRRVKRQLVEARASIGYSTPPDQPLVSVLIPTYTNSKLLLERALPSVLRQTYENIEIVIVGDACAEEHVQRIKSWIAARGESRIRFHNLPVRGSYPSDPSRRWGVAGVAPRNMAIELANGEWLAPLDDDDEFSENHIESLLDFARSGEREFVYGAVQYEKSDGSWMELGSAPLREGEVCHLSVLYHKRLSFLRYDIRAWRYNEPADWNMWRRMKWAGAKIGFLDRVVGVHYKGSNGFEK